MRLATAIGLLVSAAACGNEPSGPPPTVPPPAPQAAPAVPAAAQAGGPTMPARLSVELEDATVQEAVRVIAAATGTSIVVDPQAQEIAGCARITVLSPGPRPPDELVGLVGQALEGSGLRLETTAQGAIVRRVAGEAPPRSCLRGAVTGAAAAAPASGSEGRAGAREAVIEGIRRRDDGVFLVSREAFERLLGNQAELMRTARIIPHQEEGEVVGVKLYGIRPSSVLAALGLRNGDMVRTLNGHDLTSPEHALEAYAQLRRADRATLVIERRGRRMELRYRLVDRLP